MNHTHFMHQAIKLAIQNAQTSTGGPFGAIVVKDNTIIAQGTNLVTSTNDPTAHAEVVAIRNACRALNDFQLSGSTLYTSCEPCPMCLGAIFWARPESVYFGATQHDAADAGFDDSFIYDQLKIMPAQRSIPFIEMMRNEAQAPFDLWKKSISKIEY